jgi:uncharacterized alpha-E superfamily protein
MEPVAVLDVLLCDGTNPRSLDFQLSHVADLYSKLPRHNPDDLQSIRDALAMVRSFDLQALDNDRLNRSLRGLERLLPSWSNNLSSTYFIHALSLPTAVFE